MLHRIRTLTQCTHQSMRDLFYLSISLPPSAPPKARARRTYRHVRPPPTHTSKESSSCIFSSKFLEFRFFQNFLSLSQTLSLPLRNRSFCRCFYFLQLKLLGLLRSKKIYTVSNPILFRFFCLFFLFYVDDDVFCVYVSYYNTIAARREVSKRIISNPFLSLSLLFFIIANFSLNNSIDMQKAIFGDFCSDHADAVIGENFGKDTP